MNQYLILQETSATGVQWEYRFTMASDRMAFDYVERLMTYDPGARAAMALVLWRVEPEQFLARFTLEPAKVRVTPIQQWAAQ